MRAAAGRTIGIVLTLGLALGGCSSDASNGTDGAAGAPIDVIGGEVPFADLERLAQGLDELLGGREAFARTWTALDRGYTLAQLVFHGAGALETDGTIRDVDPDGTALGLLTDAPLALAAPLQISEGIPFEADTRRLRQRDVSLGEVYDAWIAQEVRNAGPMSAEQRLLTEVLFLLRAGYSPDQVIEAVVLGTITRTAVRDMRNWDEEREDVAQGAYGDGSVSLCTRIAGVRPAEPEPDWACLDDPSAEPAPEEAEQPEEQQPAPVEDGTFRGQVPESYFTFLTDPGNPATLAINQVTVDVLGGQAAATVRWEVDGFPIDIECTSDRVQVIESVAATGFTDGVALLPATSAVSEEFTGSGCPDLPTSAESPSQIRLTGDGPDGLLLEVLDSSGDVTISVQLSRS